MVSFIRSNLPLGTAALTPLLDDSQHGGAVYVETVAGGIYRLTADLTHDGSLRIDDLVRSVSVGQLVGLSVSLLDLDCELVQAGDALSFLPERLSPVTRVVATDDRAHDPDAAYFEAQIARVEAPSQGEAVLVPYLDRAGAQIGWQIGRRIEQPRRASNVFARLLSKRTEAAIVTGGERSALLGASMSRTLVRTADARALSHDQVDPNEPPLMERDFTDVFHLEPLAVVEVPSADRVLPLPLNQPLDVTFDHRAARVRASVARHVHEHGLRLGSQR